MSTPQSPPREATYADLEALPEHVVGEIIGGELLVSPRPAVLHALAASRLYGLLSGPFDRGQGGSGGWWILFEPELHFPKPKGKPDVVVPDLAGWRKERIPQLPDQAALELAPDWVCEVLSDKTARTDRKKKLPVYAREKVRHVWLIDPIAKILEVLRLEAGRYSIWEVYSDDDRVKAEPFEAVEIDLLDLWGETRPEER